MCDRLKLISAEYIYIYLLVEQRKISQMPVVSDVGNRGRDFPRSTM